jgi:hypothetical protein
MAIPDKHIPNYGFERKVWILARSISWSQEPEDTWQRRRHRFVMVWDAAGSAWNRIFKCDSGNETDDWLKLTAQFAQAGRPYLFYAPTPHSEYAHIGWHGIDRAMMEQLLELPFEDADFIHKRADEASPIAFPTNWSFTV